MVVRIGHRQIHRLVPDEVGRRLHAELARLVDTYITGVQGRYSPTELVVAVVRILDEVVQILLIAPSARGESNREFARHVGRQALRRLEKDDHRVLEAVRIRHFEADSTVAAEARVEGGQ